jgi:hypothetical protein
MVTFRDVEGSAPRPAAPPSQHTACIFWLKNRRPGQWRDLHDHRHIAVTKTEEQLREEILADLRDLGLFGDAGQLKAVE